MCEETKIEELRASHHVLDDKIVAANTRILPDKMKTSALKKEKLKIKDLIRQLEANG